MPVVTVVDVGAGGKEARRKIAHQHRAADVTVPAHLVDGGIKRIKERSIVRIRRRSIEVNERDAVAFTRDTDYRLSRGRHALKVSSSQFVWRR